MTNHPWDFPKLNYVLVKTGVKPLALAMGI